MPIIRNMSSISGAFNNVPVTLTDASTVAVNAALGDFFRLLFTSAIGNTRIIGAPTNPTDGQMIMFELKQDTTGSRTVTWASGAAGYLWGTDITVPTLTTTASKTDYVGFVYNSSANIWRGIAYARAY